MSATNWLLGRKFFSSMESNFRVLDRNVFSHLIIGSKLAFIVEGQHADENLLMRDLAPKPNFGHDVEED